MISIRSHLILFGLVANAFVFAACLSSCQPANEPAANEPAAKAPAGKACSKADVERAQKLVDYHKKNVWKDITYLPHRDSLLILQDARHCAGEIDFDTWCASKEAIYTELLSEANPSNPTFRKLNDLLMLSYKATQWDLYHQHLRDDMAHKIACAGSLP